MTDKYGRPIAIFDVQAVVTTTCTTTQSEHKCKKVQGPLGLDWTSAEGKAELKRILEMPNEFVETTTSRQQKGLHELIIEVKSRPTSLAKILSQLEFYRVHTNGTLVLATLYKLCAHDKEALVKQRFHHIYLDPEVVKKWHDEASRIVPVDASF